MTQENPQNEEKKSLLSDIIKASQETTSIGENSETVAQDNTWATKQAAPGTLQAQWDASVPPSPKKPREPLPPGTILKAIGALFFAGIIFFASFLAYIVFNPGEAQFFITMFGIDTKDVATILRKFINGSFGIIMLVFSILWLITLFRAFWTPREQKRKKILAWMTAALIGILLFSILTFWIYLFKKIGEIVWDGWVIGLYDNTLYTNPLSEWDAAITSTQNIIGPIDIRYDIRGNARSHEVNGTIQIERYEINFDGAICGNWTSIVSGTSPREEQWIVCTFDKVKNYNIRGTYFGKNINGEVSEIPMELDAVEVRGLVDIREQKNTSGNDIVTLDASKLMILWDPRWVYESTGDEVKTPSITLEPSETPTFIFLKVFSDSPDRIFLIQKKDLISGNEQIDTVQSTLNGLDFVLTLTGITVDKNSIVDIEWTVNDGMVICRGAKEICTYNFWGYGNYTISAIVSFANQTEKIVRREINVERPVKLIRHVIVTWSDGKMINPNSSYDEVLNSYLIDNVIPPDKVTVDARDVVPENPGYELTEVRWVMTDGRNTIEKIGERVTFDILNTYRYTIVGHYTFEKDLPGSLPDIKKATDNITIDVERKTLIPRLNIIQSSDYVPTSVTVDASQSWSENNEIIKFIYNFGEGKAEAVWDAIQKYTYTTPGEKVIVLTIIDDSGEQSQIKKTLVLKEAPRTIDFMPSISPGVIGVPVDFSVTGESGQIESYTWSFSDNTPTQRGPSVTHIFSQAGEYTITLTATYGDGTQKQATSTYIVTPWE
jgi:PKD repeat protein